MADSYKAISTATVNQGDSILFWSDSWILHNSNRPLRDHLPHLFSFVKDDKISAMDFLETEDVASMFHLPISSTTASELEHLLHWVTLLHREVTIPDVWSCPSKSDYSAKSFYTIMYTHLPTIAPCVWLWRSSCTMKIKVFGWLLFFIA